MGSGVRRTVVALWVGACSGENRGAVDDVTPILTGEGGPSSGTTFDAPFDDGVASGTAAAGTQGGIEGGAGGCADVDVEVSQVTPTVMLLIDRSGSMNASFSTSNRWNAVRDTLIGELGVVPQTEGIIRFGLATYSSLDGFSGGTCPMLELIAPELNNAANIGEVLLQDDWLVNGDTPTGEAISATVEMLRDTDVSTPTVLVLATDGEPDTCAEPDPQNGQPESLAAVQAAYEAGMTTFVISVGDDVGAAHLQEMANAGIGRDPASTDLAPYYVALEQEALIDAFTAIVGNVVSCSFEVRGEIDVGRACEGHVFLDDVELVCDSDWRASSETTIELLGQACDTLRDGHPHELRASFPCTVVAPPG